MPPRLKNGFTLIELLLVVTIIAVLTAIAVPNFLEAQARAKIARVKSDLRTAAGALETFMLDHGEYPGDYAGTIWEGLLITMQLTSPIPYLTSMHSLADPFRRDFQFAPAGIDDAYRYWNLDGRARFGPDDPAALNAQAAHGSWLLSSAGPDRKDNYPPAGPHRYETFLYDPTNGTTSDGDIIRSPRVMQ